MKELSTYEKVKKLKLRILAKSKNNFLGDNSSFLKGYGIEFNNLREYYTGDEVKRIDWRTYARTKKLLVKEYLERKDLSIYFFLDGSASNFIGSTELTKFEVAMEIMTVLAISTLKSNNKIGLVLFNADTLKMFPAKSGLINFHKLLRELILFQDDHKNSQTNFEFAVKRFLNFQHKKSVVICFSDFFSEINDFSSLKYLVKKHEIFSLVIQDPIEKELPDLGFSYLEDVETNQQVILNTHSAKVQSDYKKKSQEHNQKLKNFFASQKIKNTFLLTNENYFSKLHLLFK